MQTKRRAEESDGSSSRILVIGSGIAGLACARRLASAGRRPMVVDKGRGAGGRLATWSHQGHHFDVGAQFFTARRPAFEQQVDAWRRAGVVALWTADVGSLAEGRFEVEARRRWVGVPGMRSIADDLATGLDVRQRVRVTSLVRRSGEWLARCDDGETIAADLCVVTAPAPQTAELLPEDAGLLGDLATVEVAPCHALSVAFDAPLDAPSPTFGGAEVADAGSPLGWIARDSSKPGRPDGERWVLHTTPAWSTAHLDTPADEVAEVLRTALADALRTTVPAPSWWRVHRWRYARVLRPFGVGFLDDLAAGLVYAGDAGPGSRVEDAWHSGTTAAEAVLQGLGVSAED